MANMIAMRVIDTRIAIDDDSSGLGGSVEAAHMKHDQQNQLTLRLHVIHSTLGECPVLSPHPLPVRGRLPPPLIIVQRTLQPSASSDPTRDTSMAVLPCAPKRMRFIDDARSRRLDPHAFRATQPFPWASFNRFLTPEGFSALCTAFPDRDAFEKHTNIPKPHGQRPHNRYYLAYERSIYHRRVGPTEGVIKHDDLPLAWQKFLTELEGKGYRQFLQASLGVSDFHVRYAWHIGVAGSEVSPHVDASNKIATHIFYFNGSHEWLPEWGGDTLLLGGKRIAAMNPDFSDFDQAIAIPFLDNAGLLFANAPQAWHGVRELRAPEGKHRRLFNVIVMKKPRPVARLYGDYIQPALTRVASGWRRS